MLKDDIRAILIVKLNEEITQAVESSVDSLINADIVPIENGILEYFKKNRSYLLNSVLSEIARRV